ncbi:MAG: hypothetical protein ACXWCV_14375 [Caldimonas sp.]
MIDCGSLEYAQARVNARHGERLREATWQRIEAVRAVAPLLDLARTTALRPWLDGIAADSSVHEVDAALRGHWRTLVAEVAAWMPASWRRSLAWCAVLVDLAPLQHLARGGEAAPWMHDDAVWRELGALPPGERPAALRAGPLAALALAWPKPQTMGDAWLAEWQRRSPRPSGEAGEILGLALRTLVEHRRSFASAPAGQGWQLRQALRSRLALLLRKATLTPAAAFVHLALCALDLERLRAELLRRLAFPRWKVA